MYVPFTPLFGVFDTIGAVVQSQPGTFREDLLFSCSLRLQVITRYVESSPPCERHYVSAIVKGSDTRLERNVMGNVMPVPRDRRTEKRAKLGREKDLVES